MKSSNICNYIIAIHVTQAASFDFLMSKYNDFCSRERQLFIITTLRAKNLAKWTNIPKFFGPLNLSKAVIHKQILSLFISSKSLLDVQLASRFPRVAFGKYQKVIQCIKLFWIEKHLWILWNVWTLDIEKCLLACVTTRMS